MNIIIYIGVGILVYFLIKRQNKLTPEEIAAQKKREEEEAEMRKVQAEKQKKKEQERIKKQKEKEKKLLSDLLNSNERVYFSYSFVSKTSDLFLIDSSTNNILKFSKTNAEKLYEEGFKIVDIDKTGSSAQLEDFNFVIRFSKQM